MVRTNRAPMQPDVAGKMHISVSQIMDPQGNKSQEYFRDLDKDSLEKFEE